MKAEELQARTLDFGVRIFRLCRKLPKDQQTSVLSRQLLKSGTSIGANYREAVHASSHKHFITLMEIAQRESAETEYWLDLIIKCEIMDAARLVPLRQECHELRSILTASIITAKKRKDSKSA